MIIRCPQCQFEREIAPSVIPPTAVMATCPRCGTRFQFRTLKHQEQDPDQNQPEQEQPESAAQQQAQAPGSATLSEPSTQPSTQMQGDDPLPPGAVVTPRQEEEPQPEPAKAEAEIVPETVEKQPEDQPAEPEPQPEPHAAPSFSASAEKKPRPVLSPSDVPWELPGKYGQLNGLYQTILQVMFHPVPFFSALPRCRGKLVRAVAFYILLGMFQTLVKLFWMQNVAPAMTDPRVQELLSASSMTTSMTILLAPGILLLQLYFYAALFFLMLRLVQPEQTEFATVLRVVAYSAAPMLVCAVPVAGPIVGAVWFAACCFVGCRFALNLSWSKVTLALGPLYLIAFAVNVQLLQHLTSL